MYLQTAHRQQRLLVLSLLHLRQACMFSSAVNCHAVRLTRLGECIYACVFVCIHIYIYIYTSIYTYIYIYIILYICFKLKAHSVYAPPVKNCIHTSSYHEFRCMCVLFTCTASLQLRRAGMGW